MNAGAEVQLWMVALMSPLFVVLAALYTSVGLGGGSGYAAAMVLIGVPAESLPSTALLLNIIVTGSASIRYGLAGRIRMDILLPFLLPALPAAFIGGLCRAPHRAILLGLFLSLVIAGGVTLWSPSRNDELSRQPRLARRILIAAPTGALIGFISGLAGIGGGVLLGPVILLLGWADIREIATMSAVLVFSLSAAGLLGHGLRGSVSTSIMVPLALAACAGSLIGHRFAERQLSQTTLRRILGILVLLAGIKAGLDAVR